MAAKPMTAAEKAAKKRVVALFEEAVAARGRPIPYDLLTHRLDGAVRSTVESWFKNPDRRFPADRMLEVAQILGVDRASVVVAAGWLDAAEIERFAAGRQSDDLDAGAFHGFACAPVRAADIVLRDPVLRERFDVTLSTLTSQGRYRLATDQTAEFRLQPGAAPLPVSEALARAADHRDRWSPSGDMISAAPDYYAVRLELEAALRRSLLGCGRYTWQGDPGSSVWAHHTVGWPAHVMVQDIVSGQSRSAAGDSSWAPATPRPIVVIGGRYSSGLAGSLLAEALGWQMAVVSSKALIKEDGSIGTVYRTWEDGPAHAWSDAYQYAARRKQEEEPWRCVLLVRPYSFLKGPEGKETLDETALEQLRRADAHVVYARPAESALAWFAERQIGLAKGQTYRLRAERWRQTTDRVLRKIESVLCDRQTLHPGLDFAVVSPELNGLLPVHDPRVPAEIVDAQARLAWQVVKWLNVTVMHSGPHLPKALCPGPLKLWSESLDIERAACWPRLDMGSLPAGIRPRG